MAFNVFPMSSNFPNCVYTSYYAMGNENYIPCSFSFFPALFYIIYESASRHSLSSIILLLVSFCSITFVLVENYQVKFHLTVTNLLISIPQWRAILYVVWCFLWIFNFIPKLPGLCCRFCWHSTTCTKFSKAKETTSFFY